jgi:hypothetical protein
MQEDNFILFCRAFTKCWILVNEKGYVSVLKLFGLSAVTKWKTYQSVEKEGGSAGHITELYAYSYFGFVIPSHVLQASIYPRKHAQQNYYSILTFVFAALTLGK